MVVIADGLVMSWFFFEEVGCALYDIDGGYFH